MTLIIWRQTAFDEMDAIVRGNPDRVPAIAAALRALIAGVRATPRTFGESRPGPYRIASENPLTVYFRPAPDLGVVYLVGFRIRRPRA